jgi:chitinase
MVKVALIVISVLLCSPVLFALGVSTTTKPVVVAYVFKKEAAVQPGEIDARKLTRVNFAFADIRDGRMVTGYSADDQNMAALVGLKKENPDLTVLVSVGGWLWSGRFSDMALSKKSRKVFIDSAVDFIAQRNLDGLDIDWEYPGMAGAPGHVFRPEDKHNFTVLLKDLRERFDKEQKKLHRQLYLTIATGASTSFLANTEMKKVQKYVDTVNLMSYDYYVPGTFEFTGHHAPLFSNPLDPKKISADRSVREFMAAGVPPNKLVLGVPFYGHVWGEVPERSHGLYQTGKSVPNAYARFSDILATMLNNGYARYWDSVASVPYLYNPAKQIFVSYEDPESLALKCNYVREHKLAGVMFWDYASDTTGTLLGVIDRSLGSHGE